MKKNWILLRKGGDFQAIGERFRISPILARILRNRELTGEEELEMFLGGGIGFLHAPSLLKDMEEGAALLNQKIRDKKLIRIIGDYDIDGVMSAYILLSGIRQLGGAVDVIIPHRVKDGYGLNVSIIEECLKDGIDTILTCDNGIAAAEEIALAKKYGMQVVITDHHEVPYVLNGEEEKVYQLPPADYIINPKRPDCNYPLKASAAAWWLIN